MITQILMLGGMGGGGAEGQGNPITSIGMMVLLVVVFYFFMIRPQMKKAKDQKKFREALKEGDNVITIGGIHGKIVRLEDTTVILEMHDKSKVKFERSALVPNSADTLANQPQK